MNHAAEWVAVPVPPTRLTKKKDFCRRERTTSVKEWMENGI
jgi:hypothetical protein